MTDNDDIQYNQDNIVKYTEVKDIKDTTFHFFDLPPEIRNIIYNHFKKIKDLKTQLIIRKICREWWKLGVELINYNENGHMLFKFKLEPTVFRKILNTGFVINKMVFESYGKFKSIEYDKRKNIKKIIVNNPPYEIIMYEKIHNILRIRKVNLLSGINTIQNVAGKCISQYNPFVNDDDFTTIHPHIGIGQQIPLGVGCVIA